MKIEKLLGDGTKAVQNAKDALKRFQANPSLTKDQGEAEIAVPRLQALVKQAQDDSLDYGKSWFAWREWNGKSTYGLDDSVIKDFFADRRKLMTEQKQVGSKIDKLELLVKAAEGVKKEAQSEGKLATKALSQSRTEMAILRTDMGIVYKRIQDEKGKSLSVFVQNCQSLAKNAAGGPVSADIAGLCADIWVNAVACVKFYREIHKSLEERLKSQLKVLDPAVLEDDVVKKELLACKALVDKANTDKVTAENALKVAANNNAKIQKTAAKK